MNAPDHCAFAAALSLDVLAVLVGTGRSAGFQLAEGATSTGDGRLPGTAGLAPGRGFGRPGLRNLLRAPVLALAANRL